MNLSLIHVVGFTLSMVGLLQAASPDIGNLDNCIQEIREAAAHPPQVLTFDQYLTNYAQLISDLQMTTAKLPFVYQQAAAKPLLKFLQNLGESRYLKIFGSKPTDGETATLQEIIPDAALAILSFKNPANQGVNAFEEIVSDLYDGFLSDEERVGKQTGKPIDPPTFGIIPPLVKFGNSDFGPYTWPGDATKEILGMRCGVVSLPPEQLKGGLLAWSALGHETGGHDVTHADAGLLNELAKSVRAALMEKFHSQPLADYWASCIDETAADVCGYLNMGPSLGIGLIGYFRALGNGHLRTTGSKNDPHPIDLLRGYLAAAVIKHLNFKEADSWSQTIASETHKDDGDLQLIDQQGNRTAFPVPFQKAIASAEVVAQAIMQTKLASLQGHALEELQNWGDHDQIIVDQLVTILRMTGQLPDTLKGPGFYAAYVVAAATQAGLQKGAEISSIFREMKRFLATMHRENPTWSKTPTDKAIALLERGVKGMENGENDKSRFVIPKVPEPPLF